MEVALLKCCSDMHVCFKVLTLLVDAHTPLLKPPESDKLATAKRQLHDQIRSTSKCVQLLRPQQTALWKFSLSATVKALFKAHSDLDGRFAILISSLLHTMEKLSGEFSTPNSTEDIPCAVLFSIMFDSCEAFSLWSLDCLPSRQPTSPALLLALARLATWQLYTTRLPAPLWYQPLNRPITPCESCILLSPAVAVLLRISKQAVLDVTSLMAALPESFFTTICCIASEQLRPAAEPTTTFTALAAAQGGFTKLKPLAPTVVNCDANARAYMCKDLMQVIHAGLASAGEIDMEACTEMCTASAAREVCKLGFISAHSSQELNLNRRHLGKNDSALLLMWLIQSVNTSADLQAARFDTASARGLHFPPPMPSDLHTPHVIPQNVTTDKQLLHALCKRWPESAASMHFNAKLMTEILKSWREQNGVAVFASFITPPAMLTVTQQADAAHCLLRMARQGAGYALRFQRFCKQQRVCILPARSRMVRAPAWSDWNKRAMADVQELLLMVHMHANRYLSPGG